MPVAAPQRSLADEKVSIGQVKRDISELVNRVAFGGERIVLTSRGKLKAALVSLEDYEELRKSQQGVRMQQWARWKRKAERLVSEMSERRAGEPIDALELLAASRRDLENRGRDDG